jgi:hypothetical protein
MTVRVGVGWPKSSFTLTTRSVLKSYSSLLVGVHHFPSARQLESSAWICSVRR